MLDVSQAYVGQRVKVVSLEPDWNLPSDLLGRKGIVEIMFSTNDPYFLVRFETSVFGLYCVPEHLAALPISPEDEARYQQERQDRQRQQEDQQRRKAHADKYL